MASVVGSAVLGAARPLIGQAAEAGGGALGGAIGGVFGKKGKKVGKEIGRGIAKIGRKLLGFQAGGKVRTPPVRALKKGGIVQVVPAKPKRKSRRKK